MYASVVVSLFSPFPVNTFFAVLYSLSSSSSSSSSINISNSTISSSLLMPPNALKSLKRISASSSLDEKSSMLSSNMAFSFSFSGISQYNSSDFSIISLISNCISSILASTFSDGSVLLASYNSYNSSKIYSNGLYLCSLLPLQHFHNPYTELSSPNWISLGNSFVLSG